MSPSTEDKLISLLTEIHPISGRLSLTSNRF